MVIVSSASTTTPAATVRAEISLTGLGKTNVCDSRVLIPIILIIIVRNKEVEKLKSDFFGNDLEKPVSWEFNRNGPAPCRTACVWTPVYVRPVAVAISVAATGLVIQEGYTGTGALGLCAPAE